ncbi:hypothetical protein DFP72DRAFT_903236 [Ephemerocybe angulata]|uniref:Hemerythrin-like domain-containing protein n=1 Tax=Ephemerocybe angulata TaxID=980116 RepID=A0A8H6HVH0_9AGAR|nr:hypothetical protein DFP72DRAFT_903236 [Tulosesus angulatus]
MPSGQTSVDHNPQPSDPEDGWPTIKLPAYPFLGDTSTDFGEHIAGEMAVAHNVIIRSINSLWHSAALIPPKGHNDPTVLGYTGYALLTLKGLQEHHDSEEDVFFPALQRLGLNTMVEENVEQHRAFHDAMEELKAYLEGIQGGREVYEAQKMRKFLKEFADPLVKHLHDEIPTIRPEIMHKLDKAELDSISRALWNFHKSRGELFTTVPYLVTAHDRREAPNWPPIPGFLKWLAGKVLYRWHSSYWQFAPYNFSGEPQKFSGQK